MTAYSTSRSTTQTLTGTNADQVTLTQRWGAVRITNLHASNWLWVTPNDVVAVAEAVGAIPVPPGVSRVIDAEHVEGARTMIVGVVGNGNQYTVEGLFGSQAEVLSALADEVAEGLQGATSRLALVFYDPASPISLSTTSTTTFVDADATNLAITFTVPASGQVHVRLAAPASATAGQWGQWALKEGATLVTEPAFVTQSALSFKTCEFVISGLTPDAVKTYKWAQRTTGGTIELKIGSSDAAPQGQAIMEVWAA